MATGLFSLKRDSCPGICCWGDRLSADAAAHSLRGLCWRRPCVHQQQGPQTLPSYRFRVCVCVCCRLDLISLLCSVAVGKARPYGREFCWCAAVLLPGIFLREHLCQRSFGTLTDGQIWHDSDRHLCVSTCAHVHANALKHASVGFHLQLSDCKYLYSGW